MNVKTKLAAVETRQLLLVAGSLGVAAVATVVFHDAVRTGIIAPVADFVTVSRYLFRGVPQAVQLGVAVAVAVVVAVRVLLDPWSPAAAPAEPAGPGARRAPRLGEWRRNLDAAHRSDTSVHALAADLRRLLLVSMAGDDTDARAVVIASATDGTLDAPREVRELLSGTAAWTTPPRTTREQLLSRFPALRRLTRRLATARPVGWISARVPGRTRNVSNRSEVERSVEQVVRFLEATVRPSNASTSRESSPR